MNETIGEFLFLIEGIPKKPEYVFFIKYLLYIEKLMFLLLDPFQYQVIKQ